MVSLQQTAHWFAKFLCGLPPVMEIVWPGYVLLRFYGHRSETTKICGVFDETLALPPIFPAISVRAKP